MDPLTAALNLAAALLAFEVKVWDAMPPPVQATAATDTATFNHNVMAFLLSIQDKIKLPV
jgi:hypothetical protein